MSEYVTETVSVDDALKRANRMISIPLAVIFLSTIAASFCLCDAEVLPMGMIGVGIAAAIIFGWLYWSIMITKWKIWAFDNVRNVHELKKKAIKAGILHDDDGFLAKTAIASAADKEKLQALQAKFLRDDIFTDDYTVPEETNIYFSRSKVITWLIVGVLLLAVSVFLFVLKDSDNYFLAGIFAALGAFITLGKTKEYLNKDPQITINNKGIQSAGTDFYSWSQVANEDAVVESSGKSTNYYLIYDCPGKSVRLDIGDLPVKCNELGHLLETYRGRYEENSKHVNG